MKVPVFAMVAAIVLAAQNAPEASAPLLETAFRPLTGWDFSEWFDPWQRLLDPVFWSAAGLAATLFQTSMRRMRSPLTRVKIRRLEQRCRDLVEQIRKHDEVFTYEHLRRTHEEARWLIEALREKRWPISYLEEAEILIAILLHDVAKITWPLPVLHHEDSLTHDQWRTYVIPHPAVGAKMVKENGLGPRVAAIVESHHERKDGKGYPNRLKGDAIPLGALIGGVVDMVDAMLHHRSYRSQLSDEQILDEFFLAAGKQIDHAIAVVYLPRLLYLLQRRRDEQRAQSQDANPTLVPPDRRTHVAA